MNLVHNEQVKLSATFLNGVGLALLAVGALAPLVAATLTGTVGPVVAVIIGVCTVGAGALHALARLLLRGLRP